MNKLKQIILIVLFVGLGSGVAFASKNFNVMNNSSSFLFVNGVTGNVGISSTVPGATLDILGSIRSTTFAMTGNGASSNYVLTSLDTFGNATWSSLGGGISGWTVNTPYLYETSSGNNVGIGTTNPTGFEIEGKNVGIGTAFTGGTGEAALTVMSGNVGIGTWVPAGALDVEGTLSNAIFAGNIGIGTVSPSTQLYIHSTTGSVFTMDDGTSNITESLASNGTFTFNTSAAHSYFFSQNGTALLTIESSGQTNISSGNLGIGTGQPSSKLAVAGSASFGSNANFAGTAAPANGISVQGNIGVGTWVAANQFTVNGGVGIGTANSAFVTTVSPSGGMIVQGNVGIGSIVPGQALDVTGTTRTQYFAMSQNGASANYVLTSVDTFGNAIWSSLGGGISGWTVNTPYLYETSNANNIGIGTTNPTGFEIEGKNVGIGTAFTNTAALTVMSNVGIGTWVPAPGTTLDVEGTPSTHFYVTNSGNVGVGTWVAISQLEVSSSGTTVIDADTTAPGQGPNFALSVKGAYEYQMGYEQSLNGFFITKYGTGVDQFRIIPNGSYGNIGINTASPTGALEVEHGNVGIDTGIYGNTLTVNGGVSIGTSLTSQSYLTSAAPSGGLIVQGNVGIGSTLPGQALDVTGTTRTQYFAMSQNGASANYVLTSVDTFGNATWSSLGGGISGWTVNTPYLYETSSTNNIGIGTTNPTGFEIEGKNVGIGTAFTSSAALTVMSNVGIGTWVPAPGTTLDVEGTPSGHFYVTNSGNVGVGTWAPQATFQVAGGGNATDFQIMRAANQDYFFIKAPGGVSPIAANMGVNGGTAISVAVGNNVGIGTIAPMASLAIWNGSGNANVGIGTFIAAGGSLIVAEGNVGIGSAFPGQALDVVGTLRVLNGGSVGIGTAFTSTSGLTVMNGNVGIGTWIPGSALQVANTFSFQSEYNNGSQGGAFTINWNNGNKQKVTLTGSTSHTATFTAPTSGVTNLLLEVAQGSGTDTVSWTGSSNIKWPSNTAPTLTTTSGQVDVITCYYNSTDYFCGSNLNYTP